MKRRLILLLMIAILFVTAGCGVLRKEDRLKVGFIFQNGEQTAIGSDFVKAAVAACQKKDVMIAQKVGMSTPEAYYDAAVELIRSEQCDIIFADGFADEQKMVEVAKEYPEVEICCAGGSLAHTVQLSNFHNAYAHIYQGRYLSGVVAGMKLNEMIAAGDIEEAKMGYVGGLRDAEEISGYTAFYLGANSVCPDATMEVRFVGARRDEQKEKEAALALIEDGCVLISQQSDSMGAPNVCETKGVPNVAYGGSNAETCPETFLAACRIDWTPYFEYMITQVQSDAAIATDWVGTLENGTVVLTKPGKNIAQGTKENLESVEKALMYDDLWVFDTEKFTVNGKPVNTFVADVDFDEKAQGDTQVISDGVFKESFYRSAPYFTLEIDGISLVD